MNIIFMGQKQAGFVGLLTVVALSYTVEVVVPYDSILRDFAQWLKLPIKKSINDCDLWGYKLLVSVHGKEIVSKELLKRPYWGGINIHPFPIKGSRPIERLLEQGGETVYLRAHRMEEKVDEGYVLVERVVDIKGLKTPEEVYNKLYPNYARVLIDGIKANESWVTETELTTELMDKYYREIKEIRKTG